MGGNEAVPRAVKYLHGTAILLLGDLQALARGMYLQIWVIDSILYFISDYSMLSASVLNSDINYL